MDKLEIMYQKQKELMVRYGLSVKDLHTKEGQAQVRECGMYLFEELSEVFHLLKNKRWRETKSAIDKKQLEDEIADVTHFFIELMIFLEITPEQLLEIYLKKNKINHDRLDKGY